MCSPLPLSPLPPSHPSSHFTPTHASSEVEVQVLQSGTSGSTSILPPPQRGRGKGRRQSKTTERQPRQSYSIYEEQNVVSDGEFEIPPLAEQHHMPGAASCFLSVESNAQSLAQVEASEAAKNLAFLATHATSMASSRQSNSLELNTEAVLDGVTVSSSSTLDQQDSTVSNNSQSSNVTTASPTNVSSEIVAVAEVVSSFHESDSILTNSSTDVASAQDIAIVGTSSQSNTEDVSQENMRLSSGRNGSESLRRSRRKMTRVRRLVSEEPNSSPLEKEESENPKKTPARKRSRVSEEKGQTSKKNDTSAVIVEDISSPLPPAKRTRSTAVSRTLGGVEGGMVMGGVCDHPLEWGVTEVSEFIKGIPQCAGLVGVFQEHVSGR